MNPWGQAYRIVMKKLNGFKQAMPESHSLFREIVTTPFPPQPSLIIQIPTTTADEVEPIEKFSKYAKALKVGTHLVQMASQIKLQKLL